MQGQTASGPGSLHQVHIGKQLPLKNKQTNKHMNILGLN